MEFAAYLTSFYRIFKDHVSTIVLMLILFSHLWNLSQSSSINTMWSSHPKWTKYLVCCILVAKGSNRMMLNKKPVVPQLKSMQRSGVSSRMIIEGVRRAFTYMYIQLLATYWNDRFLEEKNRSGWIFEVFSNYQQ